MSFEAESHRDSMWRFVEAAYPIARSLTGDGVRQTLALIAEAAPAISLEIHEVPTGTPVLDWTVPREWNLRRAWLRGPNGELLADSRSHNLHVVGYSTPLQATVTLDELQPHLHSLPDQPDLIPYRTSYFEESWGFCIPHRLRKALAPGSYEVHIDASLEDGTLTYGEALIPGETSQEVLISAHVCHPSLANDNLSAVAVATALAGAAATAGARRYGVRFVFAPGTLGAITWLARNPEASRRIAHGLVLSNLGDAAQFHYKRTRDGDRHIDHLVPRALAGTGAGLEVLDFTPFGYDERQYNSPGIGLPVGALSRSVWGSYPEYHTSADDLELIRPEHLVESLDAVWRVLEAIEGARRYRNLSPAGEPQLGRRGLYDALGGGSEGRERELALLWVLNLSDGQHDLQTIAERSGLSAEAVDAATTALVEAALLERC